MCDVHFPALGGLRQALGGWTRGLRRAVRRGDACDLLFRHTDAARRRMSVEVSIQRTAIAEAGEDASSSQGTQGGVDKADLERVLVCRGASAGTSDFHSGNEASALLWALVVRDSGRVAFRLGRETFEAAERVDLSLHVSHNKSKRRCCRAWHSNIAPNI